MNTKIKRPCSKCGIKKQIVDFHKDKTNKSGTHTQCKMCVLERLDKKRAAFSVVTVKSKQCGRCKKNKLKEDFCLDRATSSGLSCYCRKCTNLLIKKSQLKKDYGITLEEKAAMFWKQEGRCAICNRHFIVPGNRNVDHDHTTGRVRGLLCSSCNFALGHLYDNGNYLDNARLYVRTGGM